MTYTINQDVDVNAAVDISGDVGINTSSPNAKLHITCSSGKRALQIAGDPGASASQVFLSGATYGIAMGMNNSSGSNYALSINNSSTSIFYLQNDGFLGIGTNAPRAPLEVINANAGVTLSNGQRQYFDYNSGPNKDASAGWTFNSVSIYARGDIVGNGYILSHASTTFSDRRIKDNIVDVEDDQCLQKLRLIKPKQYTYRDTVYRGTEPVWGFIAQEVKETLDYAVSTMQKAIPNVYKLASVSEDGLVLTFDESVTLETMDTNKLQLKTLVSEEHDVTVSEVLSSTSIRLTEPLTQEHHTGTFGDESIVRQVFVYGQYVDDFHHLNKDAIFTVAVAALQEVDRRQTSDNERILELESEVETLKAQVAALLQHTGVTV